jgi:hypothetical protein
MSDLPSTPADGNVKVVWVPTIANPDVPKVTELTGASAKDVSCYLTSGGWTPGLDEAVIADNRLCDTQTYEQPGRHSRSLSIMYITNPNGTLDDEAYETFVPGTAGYFVTRSGKAWDTALATADTINITPAKVGQRFEMPPEENTPLRVTQKVFVTGRFRERVAVVAGP